MWGHLVLLGRPWFPLNLHPADTRLNIGFSEMLPILEPQKRLWFPELLFWSTGPIEHFTPFKFSPKVWESYLLTLPLLPQSNLSLPASVIWRLSSCHVFLVALSDWGHHHLRYFWDLKNCFSLRKLFSTNVPCYGYQRPMEEVKLNTDFKHFFYNNYISPQNSMPSFKWPEEDSGAKKTNTKNTVFD